MQGHNPGGESTRFRKGQQAWNKGLPADWVLRGEDHPRWKGGEWRDKQGYVSVRLNAEEACKHPTARQPWGQAGQIARSHFVWNKTHPGDLVQPGETIHHMNHIRDDDRPENLMKLSRRDHDQFHANQRKGKPWVKKGQKLNKL